MPKDTTSDPQPSNQGGKVKKGKKTKRRGGHQYRDAAKARRHRQTRVKGLVEEIIKPAEPVEPGKPRPLKRGPKYDFAKIEKRIRASCETTEPVSTPTIPAEFYALNPVNLNVPRVIVPIYFGNRRKQEAADEDDGDTTDVDESEDAIVVPAGFIEAAENLGLLNGLASSSGPREEVEELSSAPYTQPDEEPPTAECLSTTSETPSSSSAVPETTPSASSPSSIQPSYMAPESVLAEVVYNDSQTTATTSSPIHLEPSEFSAPTSVPQASSFPDWSQEAAWSSASQYQNPTFGLEPSEFNAPTSVPQAGYVPEWSQQAAWSSVSQYQNPTFENNNTNDAQASHFYQQDIHDASYPGWTGDGFSMEFSGAATIEPSVSSLPTTWTSPQPQPEHQAFYSHDGQINDNNNDDLDYTTDYWASMEFQPSECIQQSTQIQINQLPSSHATDPLTVASCFWTALSENPGTSYSPATVPEIIQSTPTQDDERRPQEEPSKQSLSGDGPIPQHSYQDVRQYPPNNDRGVHPFPYLRAYKGMRLINMSGESDKSRVVPGPGHRCLKKLSVGSEMNLINSSRTKVKGHGAPQMSKVEHGKRRREDSFYSQYSQQESVRTGPSPSQRRRLCEPDASKLKTPIPAQRRSRNFQRRREVLKGPTSSRTPTEWNLSRFCPSISSLVDRFFKFF